MSVQPSKDIVVPSMGESITEATIARWLKQKGEPVKLDEPLVELETDKVTLEVSSPGTGILSEQLASQGASVNVGAIIGRVTGEGTASSVAPKDASPSPKPVPQYGEEIPLSPSVRKLVTENQIDPRRIEGKGKEGRLTKGDVLSLLDKEKEEVAEKSVKSSDARVERVRMSRLRQRIAERLKEAQNTAAILTTFNEVDMTNVMSLRAGLKESFEKKHGVKLGFMSFFVKACLVALKEIPAVNAEIEGDEIIYKNYYDIGIAVGTPQGLVVPVVRDANEKSFSQIEKDIAGLGQKARDGKLSMQELQGGTFTITNGGVYGSLMATPILNPPQSGILGMHKIQERPVAIDGKVEIRPMMYLALSYDHRIIDGKEAVTFLVRVKECLENPERILLDV
ncbi:MAG: 2-oxoglutarate dehydrogenase complex dihydrolipoyllysine-residue succinyltransferase [Alphaproteobacteria bacterium]|nr:2-oxoglutarate dehydrogenase complex dihydrolipoyllysine-residue succinyltransferase [Alphaproteobacteria bacterium]